MKKLNNKISIVGVFLFCTIVVGFVFVQNPLNLRIIPDGGGDEPPPPPPRPFSWKITPDPFTCYSGDTISLTWSADSGYGDRWVRIERSPNGVDSWTSVYYASWWSNNAYITYTGAVPTVDPGDSVDYYYRANFHDSSTYTGNHYNTVKITVRRDPAWNVMYYFCAEEGDFDGGRVAETNHLFVKDYMTKISTCDTDAVKFTLQYDGNNFEPTTTRFYDMGDEDTLKSASIYGGEQNMGDQSTLSDYISWAQDKYPAESYALILKGHGTGTLGDRTDIDMYLGGCCIDDTSEFDFLTVDEIKGAIDGKNINLLGFDNCEMGAIDFYYDLKNSVDVIVASEEEEPSLGWPTASICTYLTLNPLCSADEFGRQLVLFYDGFYELQEINICTGYELDINTGYYYKYEDIIFYDGSLCSINTNELYETKNKIDTLCDELIYNINQYRDIISIIRADLTEMGVASVDLRNFVDDLVHLAYLNGFSDLEVKARNLQTYLTYYLISESAYFWGGNFYQGVSIFFPNTLDEYENYVIYEETEFAQDSQWDEFILSYLT